MGLPSPAPLPSSAMVTHLMPKLRLQLCAAHGFLCGQSPSPNTNFLEEKGRKIQGTLVAFWEVEGARWVPFPTHCRGWCGLKDWSRVKPSMAWQQKA